MWLRCDAVALLVMHCGGDDDDVVCAVTQFISVTLTKLGGAETTFNDIAEVCMYSCVVLCDAADDDDGCVNGRRYFMSLTRKAVVRCPYKRCGTCCVKSLLKTP